MSHNFSKGDRIQATHSTKTYGDKTIRRGEVLFVGESDPYGSGPLSLVAGEEDRPTHYLVDPRDFELVSAPQKVDVNQGDTVTVRGLLTGTRDGHEVVDFHADATELLEHTPKPPKPTLPTTGGSTVKNYKGDLAVLLGDSAEPYYPPTWHWAKNGLKTSPRHWESGWTLDRDLGADSR